MIKSFDIFLTIMAIMAPFVFLTLYFIPAGYGKFATKKWGPSINNKTGWFIMELPVFVVMCILWLKSDRMFSPAVFTIFCTFQLHYFQRTFIFPFLMKGKSRMPLSIILFGVVFNMLNGIMQGCWLFYVSPVGRYTTEWLYSPQFILGTIVFIVGFIINIHSDSIIRNLRKPGDTNHYLPKGGMYNYVTSANYFGEILEWIGFAILTWSYAGWIFVLWSAANLVPRADTIYKRYKNEFAAQMQGKNLKRIIPFIY